MRALLIGSRGQLGSDICRVWTDELIALPHEALEVCDRDQVQSIIGREAPDLVINTAAYHRVDECESNVARAFEVNALGAKNVADASGEVGAAVVFMSTDYVFDGEKGSPYVEEDVPCPINVYGVSKLAGEHLVRQSNPRHFIVRSSGLFGTAGASGKGGNFVETMIRRARQGEALRVVDDQVFSPTFTWDLATTLRELTAGERFGTYHVTNTGETSWYRFAAKAFELTGLRPSLSAVTSEEIGAAARRPRFSVLEHRGLVAAGLPPLRPWPDALEAYLRDKGHMQPACPPGTPSAR